MEDIMSACVHVCEYEGEWREGGWKGEGILGEG